MLEIIDIVKSLQETKGSNAKRAILFNNLSNNDLRDYLKLVHEPTLTYYMKGLPESQGIFGQAPEPFNISKLKTISETLSSRKVTGFAAKQFVLQEMARMDSDTVELLRYMFKGDTCSSVGPTIINKVWPGLINVFPYRRCVLPKSSTIKSWGWGLPGFYAYSELKADGLYAAVDAKKDGTVIIKSRAGFLYPESPAFSNVRAHARALVNQYDVDQQFQGEMLVSHNGKILSREIGNGMLNSVQSSGEDLPPDHIVIMKVWDGIPLTDVVAKGKGSLTYEETFLKLISVMNQVKIDSGGLHNSIRLIEYKIIRTYAEATEHFIEKTKLGEEGTIVKHRDSVWVDGDDNFQVKMKIEVTCEFVITGYRPGEKGTKYENTLGSLLCQSSDGSLETGVSGMTDKQRDEFWNNQAHYLGSIVSVTFNDIMLSINLEKNLHSVFLPRLVEARLDKKTADSFQQMLNQLNAAKDGQVLVN